MFPAVKEKCAEWQQESRDVSDAFTLKVLNMLPEGGQWKSWRRVELPSSTEGKGTTGQGKQGCPPGIFLGEGKFFPLETPVVVLIKIKASHNAVSVQKNLSSLLLPLIIIQPSLQSVIPAY